MIGFYSMNKMFKTMKQSTLLKYVYFKIRWVQNYYLFLRDYKKFNAILQNNTEKTLSWSDRYPCLSDRTTTTSFDTHYVYHTAWAARVLQQINPIKHIDISSSIYFNAIVSAFIPIEFYDYRPAKITLNNLHPKEGNLVALPFQDNTILSLSCMHVVEHIGLGRYGDTLDSDGDKKAVKELKRLLSPNGNLLIVVPVGQPTINFNAHRVYSYEQILDFFQDFKLNEFSLLTDDENGAEFILNADSEMVKKQKYGCGCFWFQQKVAL
jgi:SAM-dependent methyltransferase